MIVVFQMKMRSKSPPPPFYSQEGLPANCIQSAMKNKSTSIRARSNGERNPCTNATCKAYNFTNAGRMTTFAPPSSSSKRSCF